MLEVYKLSIRKYHWLIIISYNRKKQTNSAVFKKYFPENFNVNRSEYNSDVSFHQVSVTEVHPLPSPIYV